MLSYDAKKKGKPKICFVLLPLQVYVEQAPHATGPGCGLGHRAFSYYWRVRNMDYKMTGWSPRRSLRSPSFYVWPGG